MGRAPCSPPLPQCSGGRVFSLAGEATGSLSVAGVIWGDGVGRRQHLRRKTPNLFGQAASLPEGLGMLREKPPLPSGHTEL